MTGRERRDEARRSSRAPGATRREAPWGLRVQERLLPTLNAVLMPGTTGLPPQLQRRTCSRNHFSSFLLRSPSNSPSSSLGLLVAERCSFGARKPILAILSSLLFRSLFLALSRSPSFDFFVLFCTPRLVPVVFTYRGILHLSFAIFLPRRFAFFLLSWTAVYLVYFSCFFFFFTYIRMLPPIDAFLSYCRSRGRYSRCFSRPRFISLSKRSPSAREAFQHPRRANPALPSLVGISHGFGLRTAVDLIAETRRDTRGPEIRYLTFVASGERSATASAINV